RVASRPFHAGASFWPRRAGRAQEVQRPARRPSAALPLPRGSLQTTRTGRWIMKMTGQLQLGVVQITSSVSGAVIGYAFTEALPHGEVQRWILTEAPVNGFVIAPPPAPMAAWTLADWQKNMESLWKPGSFYVWAQSEVYEHGGVHGGQTWMKIPPVDS